MIRTTVHRSNTLTSRLRDLETRIGARIERGLVAAGRELYDLSQVLVPVDTGALKASGMHYQKDTGLSTVVIVGYGHPDFSMGPVDSMWDGKGITRHPEDYAIHVHQVDSHHHKPPTQWNFLKGPTVTNTADIVAALRATL